MRLRRLIRTPRSAALPDDRQPRLLIVDIAGIGDLILATPSISALRERLPDARIDLVTSPRAFELLSAKSCLDHVYSFDVERFRNPSVLLRPAHLFHLWRQLRPLRANHYDALCSLNNVSTPRGALTLGILLRALKARLWIGRNTDGLAPYFDREIAESLRDPVSEAVTKLRVVAELGADPSPRPLSLPIGEAARQRAISLLCHPSPWAALMPGANISAKTWSADNFGEVGRYLAERGYGVVVLGGPEDGELASTVARISGDASIHLAGVLSLQETAAVLEKAAIAVTNDTGSMHIAAAVNTPLVAIYGPSNSVRFAPWTSESRRRIVHEIMHCNPCTYRECPMDIWCMEQVRPVQVISAVEQLLPISPSTS